MSAAGSTPAKAQIATVGEPRGIAAVDANAGDPRADPVLQAVSQGRDVSDSLGAPGDGQLERMRHADNGRHVLRTGAPARLLPPAEDDRGKDDSAADVEQPNAFGAVELMRRDREQIDVERSHVDSQPAWSRDRVAVKENASAAGELGKVGDRLYGSDLVVRVHDRGQDGVRPERPLELRRIDATLAVDRHQTRFESVFTQALQSREDGTMLDRGGHDVGRPGEPSGCAEQCQIDSLRFPRM